MIAQESAHEIGLENWEDFSLYGQYRAALERYKKKGHDYPGRADGLTPKVLQDWHRRYQEAGLMSSFDPA